MTVIRERRTWPTGRRGDRHLRDRHLRDRIPGRLPVAVAFAVHGAVSGSWAARVPWVQGHLRLAPAVLGVALLGLAGGGLTALAPAARLVSRVGSRPVVGVVVVLFPLSLALPAAAPNLPLLVVALLGYGALGAVCDVAMNAQAVAVERRARRRIMSGLHGLWSLGGLVGAAVGGLVADRFAAPPHLAVAALLLAAVGAAAAARLGPGSAPRTYRRAGADGAGEAPARHPLRRPPRWPPRWPLRPILRALPTRPSGRLVHLGLLGCAALFAEAAAADWSAVYLVRDAGGSPSLGAVGYAAFAGAMAASRLAGDSAAAVLGPARVVRTLAAVGGVGLAAALLAGRPGVGVVGFALLGVGLAGAFPFAISAAGDGRRIAAVTGAAYAGWLIAPAVIGGLAQVSSLPLALGTVVGASLLVAATAGVLPSSGRPGARSVAAAGTDIGT